jgi:PTH1 family peptidyl-tRNA hydrolase
MRVIVGLGNPGPAYVRTRHNVGFMVVDELARRWRASLDPIGGNMCGAQMTIAGEQVMLVEPHLYMNRSGSALAEITPAVTASDMIVIHDDLDLDFGAVRVKRGGGTAGHRGLDSIVECCGTDFTRIRIGIGRPLHGEEVVDHVLSPFVAEPDEDVAGVIERAADAVECVLREGEEKTMNRFNVRTKSGAGAAPAPTGRD